MGLDCIPARCPEEKHGQRADIPAGYTHAEGAPCPFAADNSPIGMLGTCCWLRGKVAAYELEALGETTLADRMYDDMTDEDAVAFAAELRASADRLELAHTNDESRPKGSGWNGTYDAKRREWVWQSYSTFEEAIASVREASRWYQKVGDLGFGVDAWY